MRLQYIQCPYPHLSSFASPLSPRANRSIRPFSQAGEGFVFVRPFDNDSIGTPVWDPARSRLPFPCFHPPLVSSTQTQTPYITHDTLPPTTIRVSSSRLRAFRVDVDYPLSFFLLARPSWPLSLSSSSIWSCPSRAVLQKLPDLGAVHADRAEVLLFHVAVFGRVQSPTSGPKEKNDRKKRSDAVGV